MNGGAAPWPGKRGETRWPQPGRDGKGAEIRIHRRACVERFLRKLLLKVFPLVLPPLRERRADIPQLVRHFTNRFARRMGRRIDIFPAEVMDALVNYPWPGNIRELENLIERAVILSPGPTLQISLGELTLPAKSVEGPPEEPVTLAEVEREHVLSVLRSTNWVVGGPNGAAVRLGLTRSTFYRMMKKLSISRIA